MTLDRRTKVLLAVLGILLGALSPAAIVAAEDFLAGYGNVDGGVQGGTDGPYIEIDGQIQLRSGNLATDDSYNLSTQNNGYVNFSATCGAFARADQLEGTWTNVSQLDVTGCDLTLDPGDKPAAGVGGQADAFKVRDTISMDDGTIDFIYTSNGGSASVTLRNLQADNRIGARDAASGELLDVATSDGSGTVTFSSLPSGAHEVEIEDAPENVTIRTESEPHDVIDEADVEIIISGSGGTVSVQNVSDGNISLVGVPLDEKYIVVVDAPGFHQRSIYVPDVFEQSTIFLLNESTPFYDQTFGIEDNTGNFQEPVIELQRPINRSLYDADAATEYQWTTIAGDRLGAAERYTTTLEQNARYRIIIREDNNVRTLGEHTAEANGTVPLTVGQISWSVPPDQRYNWSFARDPQPSAPSGEAVRFTYNDLTDNTSSVSGKIYEVGNESNVLTTFSTSGPLGKYAFTEPLAQDEANVTWQVEWSATRASDSIGSTGVGSVQRIQGVPLFTAIQSLDPDWRDAITAFVIIASGFLIGGIFSAIGALVVVGVAVVLWLIGLSSLGIGLVLLVLVSSIGYRLTAQEAA